MSDPIFDTGVLVDWLRGKPQARAELLRYPRHRISRDLDRNLRGRADGNARSCPRINRPVRNRRAGRAYSHGSSRPDGAHGPSLAAAVVLATAQVSGAILVTRNTKDFPAMMPGIRIPYQS
jgi:predicted nucleic acid-binding protein